MTQPISSSAHEVLRDAASSAAPQVAPSGEGVNRQRRLLLGAAAGIGLAGVGSAAYAIAGGGTDLQAPAFAYWRRQAKGDMSDLEYLVMCATLAPSPHNTQPWRFHLQGQSIVVQADLQRHLGAADAQHRMMQIGLGCALENIDVAASRLGLQARIDLSGADEGFHANGHCARIELTRAAPVSLAAFDAIFKRQTTRTGFDPAQDVPPVLLRAIDQAAHGLPGVRIDWLRPSPTGDLVAATVRQASRDYLNDERHRAGMKWFRIKPRDWERHGDGIAVFNNDAPLIAQRYVEYFVNEQDVMSPMFRNGEIESVDRLSAATPMWGLISAQGGRPRSRLQAGRLAERVYLEATMHDHAVQPMCYPTETPTGIAALRRLADLPDGTEPLFLFRLGRASLIAPSVRRPIREVIV
jgi:hypothetical protein